MVKATDIDNPTRRQVLATMVAVQLLATCFTLPPAPECCSLPTAFYYDRSDSEVRPPARALTSSLRLHLQYRDSPAFGHTARDSSFALAWPGLHDVPSHEEQLAERVSRRRRRRMLEGSREQGTLRNGGTLWSHDASEEEEGRVTKRETSRHSRSSSSTGPEMRTPPGAWSPRYTPRAPVSRRKRLARRLTTTFESLLSNSRTNGARHSFRYQNPLPVKTQQSTHIWSFQPIIRSEDHPVFIQPIKDHVIRRWKALRTLSPSLSSSSNAGSGRSRQSHRFHRTAEIWNAEPTIPVGMCRRTSESPASNTEAIPMITPTSAAEAGQERTNTCLFSDVRWCAGRSSGFDDVLGRPVSPLTREPGAAHEDDDGTSPSLEAVTSHQPVSFAARAHRSSTVDTVLVSSRPSISNQTYMPPNSAAVVSGACGAAGDDMPDLRLGQLHFL